MNDQEPLKLSVKNQKIAKYCTIFWTIIYTLLYPVFCYLALLSGMILDNPDINASIGLNILLIAFCVPLSMPLTIYLMWSRYLKGQYRKTFWVWMLPILTCIAYFLFIMVLGKIFLA